MRDTNRTQRITCGAAIGGLYVVLTLLSGMLGLANGPVQLRLSEMLTVLPAFTEAAVPGLFVGCITANLLTGALPWDVVFGSLATLIGAVLTGKFRSKPRLAPVFPILSNGLIIPFVLKWVYGLEGSYLYFLISVVAGETVCCGILGSFLIKTVRRTSIFCQR